MRNPYSHIGTEPLIATNRGTPEYFVSAKLDNQVNFQNSVKSLMSAGASLGYTANIPNNKFFPDDVVDVNTIPTINLKHDHKH